MILLRNVGSTAVSHLLHKLEAEYDLVVLVCDASYSQWTHFCLQNSDCLLLVGNECSSPEMNESEQSLYQAKEGVFAMPKHLILMHENNTILPQGTSVWLEQRQDTFIHHLCFHQAQTFSRLARIITNQSVGLVLSGGGSNGYAHIGVLKAFQEYGIDIDVICGVSVGSVIGALHAMGLTTEEITKRFKEFVQITKRRILLLIQLPISSVVSPTQNNKISRILWGDTQIEDLWINYFCLACSLSTTNEHIFDRGSLLGVKLQVWGKSDIDHLK